MADLPPLKSAPPFADAFGEVLPAASSLPPITPAQGGWAALIVLAMQNLVSLVALRAGLPLGVALLLAFVATVLLFFLTMRRTAQMLFQDSRWRNAPNIGVALGVFALAFVASRAILVFLLSIWPAGAQTVPQFLSSGADVWVLLLVAGFLIPLAEEVAFRGLLMRGVEYARGPLFAALLSSAFFGLAHGAPAQVIAILPLAWLMARAVQHSNSLWTSITIHVLNNSLAVGLAAFLQGRALGALTGDVGGLKIPLSLGLAGLLVGGASLLIGTLWLVPRLPASPRPHLPVFTFSTVLLGILVLAAVALSTLPLFLKPGSVPGV